MRIVPVLLGFVLLAAAPLRADDADPFADPVTGDRMNAAFGFPLWFGDRSLWQEDDATAAERIDAPLESRTSDQASFRLYPKAKVRVFGARPYSMALYGRDGKAESLSIVFANKGDFFSKDKDDGESRTFHDAVKGDEAAIAAKLTELLGSPGTLNFGVSGMQEKMRRWDWNGHAFLLAAPRGEYVVLRVLSTEAAARFGQPEGISNGRLAEILSSRVVRRDNGDVVLGEMPMVNQGPKGYCVPATWERYLRYQLIPADMYVLAMAGGTSEGGGSNPAAFVAAAANLVRSRALRIEQIEPVRLDPDSIAKNIDQGLPMMWTCFVNLDLEKKINLRAKKRRETTDWDAYAASLQQDREDSSDYLAHAADGSHMRMIVGYNARTREIAISDSWGPWAAERWITPQEAMATNGGGLYVIRW